MLHCLSAGMITGFDLRLFISAEPGDAFSVGPHRDTKMCLCVFVCLCVSDGQVVDSPGPHFPSL